MKLKYFVVFILIVFGAIYFTDLSVTTGKNTAEVLISYTLMIFFFFLGYLKFKKIINPISLLFPLYLGYFYYQFMFSTKQNVLTLEVIVCFYLFIYSYLIGCLFKFSSYIPSKSKISKSQSVIIHCSFLLGCLVFLFECFINGGFPLFISIIGGKEIYADMFALPILHYFVMLTALVPAIYYYLFKKSLLKKYIYYIALVLSVFILLNTLSRQIMILGIVSFFFTYIKINNIPIDKLLLKFGGGAVLLFFAVGAIRIAAMDSNVNVADYLKLYSGVPKKLDINTFDITFNLYATLNFNTLNDIIKNTNDFSFGLYTLRPIIELFQYDAAFSYVYEEKFNGFVRLATIISDPYLDFGYVGVVIMGGVYGIIVAGAFRNYLNSHNLGACLIWSVLVYTMVMSVFANFFNVLF